MNLLNAGILLQHIIYRASQDSPPYAVDDRDSLQTVKNRPVDKPINLLERILALHSPHHQLCRDRPARDARTPRNGSIVIVTPPLGRREIVDIRFYTKPAGKFQEDPARTALQGQQPAFLADARDLIPGPLLHIFDTKIALSSFHR